LVPNEGFTSIHDPLLMKESYSFYMASFHSSGEVASSKEFHSRLANKLYSQSYTSPKLESFGSPPFYFLVELLVPIFPTSQRMNTYKCLYDPFELSMRFQVS